MQQTLSVAYSFYLLLSQLLLSFPLFHCIIFSDYIYPVINVLFQIMALNGLHCAQCWCASHSLVV